MTKRFVVELSLLILLSASAAAQTITSMSRTPVAIRVGSTQPVNYVVFTSGTPTGLRLDLQAGGSVTLTQTSAGRWEASITAAQALFGFDTNDVNHNHVGFLRLLGAGGSVITTYNQFINVLHANVPAVTVQDLPNDARRTARVLNLRRPALVLSPETSPAARFEDSKKAVREVYANLPDNFDFVNVAYSLPSYFQNRGHSLIRNVVSGIGMTLKDETSQWGSAGKLLGMTIFPNDTIFDFAEPSASHETAHQWVMFLQHPLLRPGVPHWPPSTMGRGIMGVTLPGGAGGNFPWTITQLTPTTVRTEFSTTTNDFDDIDLYLMGLLAPESVRPGIVLQGTACPNCTLPAAPITVNDIIAVEGPRIPNVAQSQKNFRLATVIITHDRLLSDDEMAMFEYFVARGEARTEVPYSSGFTVGTAKPWFVATRGVSTLDFRLGEAPKRRRPTRR